MWIQFLNKKQVGSISYFFQVSCEANIMFDRLKCFVKKDRLPFHCQKRQSNATKLPHLKIFGNFFPHFDTVNSG